MTLFFSLKYFFMYIFVPKLILNRNHGKASRGVGAQACNCKTDWLWVRYPLEEVKYSFTFIFSFLRSGAEAKRGVKFCHLTRNASRIRQKVRNGVSYTRFLLLTLLCVGIQREADIDLFALVLGKER